MMGAAVPDRRTDAAFSEAVAVPLSLREERTCRAIGAAALAALYTELWACPKPGLVSLADNGSHVDMDASTFLRSLSALTVYFPQVAAAGVRDAGFEALRRAGLEAEARMLRATGNVNTHRGAIFTLGLLASAAGRIFCAGGSFGGDALGRAVADLWGRDILAASQANPWSHGQLVARRYGASGAREEAAAGFPHVFAVGLPTLRGALAKGAGLNAAAVQAFFSLLAVVPDNNLLFRGGTRGSHLCQAAGPVVPGEGRRIQGELAGGRPQHPPGARRAPLKPRRQRRPPGSRHIRTLHPSQRVTPPLNRARPAPLDPGPQSHYTLSL